MESKSHRPFIKFGVSTEKRPKVENKLVGITEPHVWEEMTSSEFPTNFFLRNQNGSSMCGAMGPAEVINFQIGTVVSAQPFYSRRPNKPDEGMSLDYILAIPCTEGTCLESALPSNNLTEKEADAPVLVPTPITGSLPVELNIDDIEELASACDQYGGIIVTVNVAWEEWNSEQGVPVYIPNAEVSGGHCIACLKGIIYNGMRGMLCKNSWGNDDDSINNSSWIFLSQDFLTNRGTGAGAFVKPTIMEQTTQLPVVTLQRTVDDGIETRGNLTYGDFVCSTLERPWKNNELNISCVPAGTFICQQEYLGTMKGVYYELQNVKERTGIFIHPGNYVTDVEGCILLGKDFADLNGDGELDITSSVETISAFDELMKGEPFTLVIKDVV